jgi:hypothetical protein
MSTNDIPTLTVNNYAVSEGVTNYAARYELTASWLVPTQVDLTYINFATVKSCFNRTKANAFFNRANWQRIFVVWISKSKNVKVNILIYSKYIVYDLFHSFQYVLVKKLFETAS